MSWDSISNFSSLLSIIGAIGSGFSFLKIRAYYKRITEINDLEKLTFINNDLLEVRSIYEDIRSYYISQSKRGITEKKIITHYTQIRRLLNKMRKELPSKYKDILDLVVDANKQIDEIDARDLYHEKNIYFQELEVCITNIEDVIKLEKENIRGF